MTLPLADPSASRGRLFFFPYIWLTMTFFLVTPPTLPSFLFPLPPLAQIEFWSVAENILFPTVAMLRIQISVPLQFSLPPLPASGRNLLELCKSSFFPKRANG